MLVTGGVGIVEPEPVLYPGIFDELPPIEEIKESPDPVHNISLEAVLGRSGGGLQCIGFVKEFFPEIQGNAIDVQPNSDIPDIGFAVLTTESELGHIAIITDIQEGSLILSESNYNFDEMITHGRKLSTDSPVIRGYLSPHIP